MLLFYCVGVVVGSVIQDQHLCHVQLGRCGCVGSHAEESCGGWRGLHCGLDKIFVLATDHSFVSDFCQISATQPQTPVCPPPGFSAACCSPPQALLLRLPPEEPSRWQAA